MKKIIVTVVLLSSISQKRGTEEKIVDQEVTECNVVVEQEKKDSVLYKKTTVSYYGKGDGFHGKTMANGKRFDRDKLTAATGLKNGKPIIPLGSWVRVTNLNNGKSVIVQITDTGGFKKHGRDLDLSAGAFKELGKLDKGLLKNIKVELLEDGYNKL